jgi:thiamine pyrophosphokinase
MKVAIILKAPQLNDVVAEDKVIFADAGYKYKDVIGDKQVLGVVGDFDSLGDAPKNEKIINLNVEKNFTDGERAVHYAKECGADHVVIYGAYGGKIEHVLGNISLLKIAKNIGLKASIKDGEYTTELICGKTKLMAEKSSTLSLIPYGGECVFNSSKGLYYPLENLTLTPADTRGISNVVQDNIVELDICLGESLVIYKKA